MAEAIHPGSTLHSRCPSFVIHSLSRIESRQSWVKVRQHQETPHLPQHLPTAGEWSMIRRKEEDNCQAGAAILRVLNGGAERRECVMCDRTSNGCSRSIDTAISPWRAFNPGLSEGDRSRYLYLPLSAVCIGNQRTASSFLLASSEPRHSTRPSQSNLSISELAPWRLSLTSHRQSQAANKQTVRRWATLVLASPGSLRQHCSRATNTSERRGSNGGDVTCSNRSLQRYPRHGGTTLTSSRHRRSSSPFAVPHRRRSPSTNAVREQPPE